MTEHSLTELFEMASRCREQAWAPYSEFRVGAALETVDGQVFTGCNVENASYGLAICAERVAITKAIAAGCRTFARIVVVAHPLASPCGACRQVLGEFFEDDAEIWAMEAGNSGNRNRWTMAELLPDRFRLKPVQPDYRRDRGTE
jgi:cytidine deaminase